MSQVEVRVGPPGCGKTTEFVIETTTRPHRYIIALPTIGLLEEVAGRLCHEAAKSGTLPVIRAVHGRAEGQRSVIVSRMIMEAIEEYATLPHVILIITHEGMMATDFHSTAASSWHIRIDEVPSAIAAGEFRIPSASRYFEAAYTLTATEDNWHQVALASDAPRMMDMMADDLLKGLAAFHKRAKSPQGVCVDVKDWREARDRGRVVRWWSVWTPAELAPFASAAIAAAGFFHSLTYLAMRKWHGEEVVFVRRKVAPAATRQKARVCIRYFTHAHRASSEWWFPTRDRKKFDDGHAGSSAGKGGEGHRLPPGKDCLARVCRHLESIVDLGFWSGNEKVVTYFEGRLPGQQVRPKVAGSNEYRNLTSCAFIYSSKARPEDAVLLSVFGLSREEVERAREQEDIWQFVTRGAIRQAEFDGLYTVYLYDHWQAEMLAQMLRDAGMAGDVQIEPVVEAGVLDVERPRPGPKPGAKAEKSEKSFEDQQAERREADRRRKQQQRERERATKAAEGSLRSRGRPRKADGEARS